MSPTTCPSQLVCSKHVDSVAQISRFSVNRLVRTGYRDEPILWYVDKMRQQIRALLVQMLSSSLTQWTSATNDVFCWDSVWINRVLHTDSSFVYMMLGWICEPPHWFPVEVEYSFSVIGFPASGRINFFAKSLSVRCPFRSGGSKSALPGPIMLAVDERLVLGVMGVTGCGFSSVFFSCLGLFSLVMLELLCQICYVCSDLFVKISLTQVNLCLCFGIVRLQSRFVYNFSNHFRTHVIFFYRICVMLLHRFLWLIFWLMTFWQFLVLF